MYNTRAVSCKHSIKHHPKGLHSLPAPQGGSEVVGNLVAAAAHIPEKDDATGIAESDVTHIVQKRRQINHVVARRDMRPDFGAVKDKVQNSSLDTHFYAPQLIERVTTA